MTARRSWSVAALAVAALTLAGCPNGDVDRDDVEETLQEAGASDDQASCVADRLDDELDQEQLNDVGSADELSDLSNALEGTVNAVLAECLEGSTDSPTEAENEADTTDTTEATTTTVG